MSFIIDPYKFVVAGGGGCELLSGAPTTDLQFDFVGDCLTGANDDPISTWEDAHSTNNDATQSDSDRKPLVKTSLLNGSKGSFWDNGVLECRLSLASSISTQVFTFIAVIRSQNQSVIQALFGSSGVSGGPSLRVNTAGKLALAKQGTAEMGASNTALNTSDFYTVGVTYSSPNIAYYLNGSADGTPSSAQTFTQPISSFGWGFTGSPQESWQGYIVEALLWDAVLSGGDLTTVFSALQTKYGHY